MPVQLQTGCPFQFSVRDFIRRAVIYSEGRSTQTSRQLYRPEKPRQPLDDPDLVADLKDRKPDAFRRACDIHLSSLWRYVYWAAGSNQHLAEDIVGETLLELVESVDSLDPNDCRLGGWLRVVARNKLIDYQRSVARVRRLVEEVSRNGHHRETSSDGPAEELEKKERIDTVRKLLDCLSDQHRLVLEWKYVDGLSVRAIAKRWSTTEKAVESILFRARNSFRKEAEQLDAKEAAAHREDPGELLWLAASRQDAAGQHPTGHQNMGQQASNQHRSQGNPD